MSTARDEIAAIIKMGYWRVDARDTPVLSRLAAQHFNDPLTTPAVRARLRRAAHSLSPAYEEAAFTLLGISDEAADLKLGQRQTLAGETPGLPRLQAPSTVRGPGGLQEYLIVRLAAYFEEGPSLAAGDPSTGRPYLNLEYAIAMEEREGEPVWELATDFTLEALRPNVDIVTTGLHGHEWQMEDVRVESPGHEIIGIRQRDKTGKGPQQLIIGIDAPLPVGIPAKFRVTERVRIDASDPARVLAANVAAYPTKVRLSARVPQFVPEYVRSHGIRRVNQFHETSSERVTNDNGAAMTWDITAGEPFTRYALRWRIDHVGNHQPKPIS
jgi:hypothetical protein